MISHVIYLIPIILLSAVLQIVAHEIGHMIGGLLTGWRLLHIQLHKYLFVNENGKYHIKRVRNSSFQCMMYPEHGNDSPLLYTVMGCYMNLAVTALVAMLLLLNAELILYFIWFILFGVIQFIINFLPNSKRLCNDGFCYRILQSDKTSCYSHNMQLTVAKKLQAGYSYKEIIPELACLNSNYAGNDITAYHAVLEYYYHMDRSEYEAAKKALIKIDRNGDISKKMMDIVLLEEVYLELWKWILNKEERPLITSKYESNMKQYINKHAERGDINSLRIKAIWKVYDCILNSQYRSARLRLEKAEVEIMNTLCVYKGEKLFNINQMKKIRDCLDYEG